jgi:GNAT superfamily N-acetyltransferase
VITLEEAKPHDAPRLLALRDEAARWMQQTGVQQWARGEVSLGEVRAQIAGRQWFILRQSESVVAGLRLLWADEPMWGPRPADAAYVHGLVIDRRRAGDGLGTALLTWAEDRASADGRSFLRLDCVEGNLALRSYYARAGFLQVGRRDFDGAWHSAVLLEKQLA